MGVHCRQALQRRGGNRRSQLLVGMPMWPGLERAPEKIRGKYERQTLMKLRGGTVGARAAGA